MLLRPSRKKTPHRADGVSTFNLDCPSIGQALAPCLLAGCCAVIELVSRALFMVKIMIADRRFLVKGFSMAKAMDQKKAALWAAFEVNPKS